jgi:ABC-2 type transport system permease protein
MAAPTQADAAPSPRKAAPVALTLVRLKGRLMLNKARAENKVAAVLAPLAALIMGVIGFSLTAGSSTFRDPRASRVLVVLGATMLLVGWTIIPLVSFGTDETLDPSRLVLLPLRRRPLMRGLLLSSLVGYAPAAVALTIVGIVVGYGHGAGAFVVLAAMLLLLVLCAATARATSTALASRLTSRRGRDAMVIVVSLLVLALQGLRFLRLNTGDLSALNGLADVLRWTPPGMLGQAVIDADNGRLLVAIAELVPALVLIPLLLVLWGRVLDRALTVVTGGSSVLSGAHSTAALPLLPRRLPFIKASAWGAVAAKELRYLGRDPRRKVLLLNSLILGAAFPLYFGVRSGSLSPAVVLLSSLTGYVTVLNSMNQFGFDGGALWLDIVAGQVVRTELIGKNVATVVTVMPGVLVAAVILAAFSGGWLFVPAALLLGLGGVGVGLSVANVTSVRFPQRVPDTRSPFGGAGAGTGCVTAIAMLGAMVVQGALLTPVVIAATIAVLAFPPALIVVAPMAVGYGFVLWRVGLGMADRWAWWRQPELLKAVDPARV